MKAPHTPGPWTANPRNEGWITGPDGKDLLNFGQRSPRQVAANSRLICAAPELLEACYQAAFAIPTTHAAFETVRAAIAKAQGKD